MLGQSPVPYCIKLQGQSFIVQCITYCWTVTTSSHEGTLQMKKADMERCNKLTEMRSQVRQCVSQCGFSHDSICNKTTSRLNPRLKSLTKVQEFQIQIDSVYTCVSVFVVFLSVKDVRLHVQACMYAFLCSRCIVFF